MRRFFILKFALKLLITISCYAFFVIKILVLIDGVLVGIKLLSRF